MSYGDICDAFEQLTPSDKALFIDSRLAWASGGALCAEIRMRICEPLNDD